MADNPVPELNQKTPLEAARKPHMDALCAKSLLGSVRTVPPEQLPGSDTAILSIFGCDPNRYFTGRSPLEAAGSGISIQPGDVSYRCNMVALEDGDKPFGEKKMLSHSAGSIDGEDSMAVISWLFDNGIYLDLVGKIGRMKNSFDIQYDAVDSSGDYHTNAVSLSAELGWRYYATENLFVEPQAEMWYGHVFDADYRTSTGIDVDNKSVDSLVGRLGLKLGFDFPDELGSFFLKVLSIKHRFLFSHKFLLRHWFLF